MSIAQATFSCHESLFCFQSLRFFPSCPKLSIGGHEIVAARFPRLYPHWISSVSLVPVLFNFLNAVQSF